MSVNDKNELTAFSKDKLVDIVLSLRGEMSKLKEDFVKLTNLRFYHIERDLNLSAQYNRRESFEIAGIPPRITDDQLEDEVIDIAREATFL